ANREAVQLTVLPDLDRESPPATLDKDLVTLSYDGGKVGFRVIERAGSVSVQRVYTMDLDGTNLREIRDAAPGDRSCGWQPDWFAPWKADNSRYPPGTAAVAPPSASRMVNDPLANESTALVARALSTFVASLTRALATPGLPPGQANHLQDVKAVIVLIQGMPGGTAWTSASPPAAAAIPPGGPTSSWDDVKGRLIFRLNQVTGQFSGDQQRAMQRWCSGLQMLFDGCREYKTGNKADGMQELVLASQLFHDWPICSGERFPKSSIPKAPKSSDGHHQDDYGH
ncbi:MAG: hypothetical protein HY815_05915, partial [Candidatus Riflebacteria bacterium]|nr:hypothetical protein [Candidatus Riflebacteria bacterium]